MANAPPLPVQAMVPVDDPMELKMVVQKWISLFLQLISAAKNPNHGSKGLLTQSDVQLLFLDEGHWRDLVCLSWDFRTLSGVERITSFLNEKNGRLGLIDRVALDNDSPSRTVRSFPIDPDGPVMGIQAFLAMKLKFGADALGVLRLGRDLDGSWKAWTLSTVLQDIHGCSPQVGPKRPIHLPYGFQSGRMNWGTSRALELDMTDQEPTVLIVGMIELFTFLNDVCWLV